VPADVCEVHPNETVDLFVKDPRLDMASFRRNVHFDVRGEQGTWHWPERRAVLV
jgi:hypothetical protein